MRALRHPAELARATALGAFAVYAAWNLAWLSRGRVPPSILYAVTGVPCPTTGCTRSLLALAHGDLTESLLLNPFTLVYLALLAMTFLALLKRFCARQPMTLPTWVGWAWAASLLAGWVAKITLPFAR